VATRLIPVNPVADDQKLYAMKGLCLVASLGRHIHGSSRVVFWGGPPATDFDDSHGHERRHQYQYRGRSALVLVALHQICDFFKKSQI
jgi:hypothetical protein